MAAPARTRVLVVDDHPVTARGIAVALSEHADLAVVGLARTAEEAERIAAESAVDVLVADLHLPDRSGTELAHAVRQSHPRVAVLILSADDSSEAMLEAVRAGASGYLVKTGDERTIVDAVRRAAAGEILVPPSMLAELLRQERRTAAARAERDRIRASLTRRELDVLRLAAEGLDNAAIAARLEIAVNSVRGYVQSLLAKVGAHSKLEAVAVAARLGLLED